MKSLVSFVMNIAVLSTVVALLCAHNAAHATTSTCTLQTCTSIQIAAYESDISGNSTGGTPVCFNNQTTIGMYVGKATGCESGYTLKCGKNSSYYLTLTNNCTNPDDFVSRICSCELEYKECTDCESFDWSAYGAGTELKVTATCNHSTGQCSRLFQTRCATNYYGAAESVENPPSACKLCPYIVINGDSVGTAGGDAAYITDCYAPKDRNISAPEGIFQFTDDCYYE